MLDSELQRRFVQTLSQVPATVNRDGRTALLIGLPPNISAGLNRSDNCITDLTNIITQLDRLGRLEKTGERPLIVVAGNALMHVEGTETGRAIKEIIQELEQHYGGDPPSESLPPVPEILIFEGRDEQLPRSFLDKALSVGNSIVRLQVPRIVNGHFQEGEHAFGTGWLVAPGMLLTNHHVIAARELGEPDATEAECQAQASNTVVWFDYHKEGGAHLEYRCVELICSDVDLDYALVRLESADQLDERQPLPIVRQPQTLHTRDRLNIVQYPRGGPLKYAIRNNYYVGTGDTPDHIRYLTDTEGGSSGSPVLNDGWQVIGMHHAYRQVPEEVYKGDVIKYHNQGIAIHAILYQLSPEVRQEIETAQGWL
jgi:V8-like Glu-specific endopeptidase